MTAWRVPETMRLKALSLLRGAARVWRRRGALGLSAGFGVTLLAVAAVYGALIVANSRISLDFVLPADAAGVDRAAAIIVGRLDALKAHTGAPVLPNFRRARTAILSAAAERAMEEAADAPDAVALSRRAASALRRERVALTAGTATPLEREARLSHARGAAWAWALLLDAAAGPDPDAPAIEAACAALEAAAKRDPGIAFDQRASREAMIHGLERALELLDAVASAQQRP